MRLQQVSGDELTTGFMLYDAVKRFLRQRSQRMQAQVRHERVSKMNQEKTPMLLFGQEDRG
jgi:hypothetical protein